MEFCKITIKDFDHLIIKINNYDKFGAYLVCIYSNLSALDLSEMIFWHGIIVLLNCDFKSTILIYLIVIPRTIGHYFMSEAYIMKFKNVRAGSY